MNYEFYKIWNKKARAKKITSEDMLQYAILHAMSYYHKDRQQEIADDLLQHAYTAITNTNKLTCCALSPYDALYHAASNSKIYKGITLNQNDLRSSLDTEEDIMVFNRLIDNALPDIRDKYDKKQLEYYSYIIVRQDISPEQQAIQGQHAFGKMSFLLGADSEFGKHWEEVPFMISELNIAYIGVPDEDGVRGMTEYFYSHGYNTEEFREPDMRGNPVTAMASYPIKAGKRKFMSRYKRLKFSNTVR